MNNKFTSGWWLFISAMVVSLPSSNTLTYVWNFGSILGIVYVFQVFTGIMLAMYYNPASSLAFGSVQFIMSEVNSGWVFRITHFNVASLFFLVLFLHVFNGLYFFSYRLTWVWVSGVTILLLIILVAFIGYVLPWAQMSFWAAIVITSLISVVPYISNILLLWVWGGFSVGSATLGLFFVLHFILPLFLYILILFHLRSLHSTGSTSILFCVGGEHDNVTFFPYFLVNDLINITSWLVFFIFCILYPFLLGDSEIFVAANSLVSPVHIVPEWYFLFAYAVLRSVPNNLLGVVALVFSVIVLYLLVFVISYVTPLDVINAYIIIYFASVCIVLTWVGQCPVEVPYIIVGRWCTILYFILLGGVVLLQSINMFKCVAVPPRPRVKRYCRVCIQTPVEALPEVNCFKYPGVHRGN